MNEGIEVVKIKFDKRSVQIYPRGSEFLPMRLFCHKGDNHN